MASITRLSHTSKNRENPRGKSVLLDDSLRFN